MKLKLMIDDLRSILSSYFQITTCVVHGRLCVCVGVCVEEIIFVTSLIHNIKGKNMLIK